MQPADKTVLWHTTSLPEAFTKVIVIIQMIKQPHLCWLYQSLDLNTEEQYFKSCGIKVVHILGHFVLQDGATVAVFIMVSLVEMVSNTFNFRSSATAHSGTTN